MRYESQKTERGNVGVSYKSQEAADAQAASMDANDCRYCRYCTNCSGCTGCTGCTDCTDCRYCRYCTNCSDCTGCTDCRYCRYCTNCSDCTDTIGAMQWGGGPAKNLLSINGLRWPVSTDGKSIQIGCQYHSVEDWKNFDDRVIAQMAGDALTFWKWHKEMILSLAEVRKNMEEENG